MKKQLMLRVVCLAAIFTLTACADDKSETDSNENMNSSTSKEESENMDHSMMHHSTSGEVPKGLKVAENPTYPVGSQAIIETDHMQGMKGAVATIVGAYDTTVYTISYTPTTGGEKVSNHKWIIHEEIKDAGDETIKPGSKVTIEANHMEGMQGATAEIDSAEKTTVYMVDYTSTTDGEKVTNHKWVTESELSSK